MPTYGIIKSYIGGWVIDAEPHVMGRARAMFSRGKNLWEAGRYTHKQLELSKCREVAKDLLWLCSRYAMEFDAGVQEDLERLPKEYDDIAASVMDADKDPPPTWRVTPGMLEPSLPLYEHQIKFVNMARQVKKILLADGLGTGKTISSLGVGAYPDTRPCLVICPTHLRIQWEREIKRLYPMATTQILYGYAPRAIDSTDFVITSYNRVSYWIDQLIAYGPTTVIMDEVHELRKRAPKSATPASKLQPNVIILWVSRELQFTITVEKYGAPLIRLKTAVSESRTPSMTSGVIGVKSASLRSQVTT